MKTSENQNSSTLILNNQSEQLIRKLFVSPDYSITALKAVSSGLPSLHKLGRNKSIMASMAAILNRYIGIYHPGTDSQIVADEAVELLYDVRRDWNVADFQAFINFMKRNKPETSGHKITPSEILESSAKYELDRCAIIESQHHSRKYEKLEPVSDSVKAELDKLLERLEAKQKMKIENINHKIDIASAAELRRIEYSHLLMQMIKKGEISENKAVELMNDFNKNQKQ